MTDNPKSDEVAVQKAMRCEFVRGAESMRERAVALIDWAGYKTLAVQVSKLPLDGEVGK